MNNPYEFYCKTVKDYKEGKEVDVVNLRKVLLALDKIYASGEKTPLTDEEYDEIHQIYISLTGEVIRGDMVDGNRIKVKHDYPELKGTIKKVHYITKKEKEEDPNAVKAHKVLYEWYMDTLEKLSKDGKPHYLGFWPKYDGCSLILSLDENRRVTKAITRGDEEFGVDKTHLFNNAYLVDMIPNELKGKVGLKCECIMKKSVFKKFNKKYGDPNKPFANERTAITSLLNSENITDIHMEYMTLIPLMMEYQGEFKCFEIKDYNHDYGPVITMPYRTDEKKSRKPLTENTMKNCINSMKDYINDLDFNCDGVVVRWFDSDAMKLLGRDESNYVNKFEIAYKFPKANNYTKVIDIRQDIGMLGQVSFTAILEPIMINDKIIKHASLGSYDRAKGLNLAKGDMVNIKYEIVPYLCVDDYCLKNKSGNEPIKLIDICPYCGEKLEKEPVLACVNPNCPSRVQGKINNFCIRMNMTGIGPSTIETLFNNGILSCIQDLWRLNNKKDKFCLIDGLGEKTYKSLEKQIKHFSATPSQILSSVGIKGIGPKKAKEVLGIYHLSELMLVVTQDNALEKFKERGITNKLAENLEKGVRENYGLLQFLIRHINIKDEPKNKKGVIVFTGFRNGAFKAFLEKHGFEVSDNISKKVNLVITDNIDSNTDKMKKAKKLSIPIINEYEAYSKFKFKE